MNKLNETKKRIALLIEYNGNGFVGWQKQNNGQSVQNLIESSFENLFQLKFNVQAAGRTDAGVHALGQVAHTDIPEKNIFLSKNNFYLVSALNNFLKDTRVRILSIQKTTNDFDARFSALKRYYVYKFLFRSAPSALDNKRFWHVRKKVNIDAMKEGSKYLIGEHDFTSFRSTQCQSKRVKKTIDSIKFSFKNNVLSMRVEAKSFLHNQIRIIAGTLLKVGTDYWKPDELKYILDGKSRNLAGETAPAYGLYLEKIDYPKKLLNSIWKYNIYD